jgi:heat-inducible transcriptional repressor
MQEPLNHRARRILFAVVTEYIETGEPVGSRTLARRYGLDLSAASIRNVLSDLEEGGLLLQPHTSAGRVPTDRAIRLFIDTLMEARSASPQERAQLKEKVANIYAREQDPLRESGRLLSELSGKAAIVARQTRGRTLQQLRFIPTRPGQILAVLVFQDGAVENRFLGFEGVIPETELTRIHNLLADVIEGRTLGEVRELFARRLADDRASIDALKRKAFALAHQAVDGVASKSEILIEGQLRLIDLPEYGDVEKLRNLVVTLEEREDLVSLLDKTLESGAVTVYVGSEAGELGAGQLSLVVAPFSDNGQQAGAVGVLGPTRMDYARMMPLVDATAAAIADAISGGARKG